MTLGRNLNIFLAVTSLFCAPVFAEDEPVVAPTLASVEAQPAAKIEEPPSYDYAIDNGLYATVTAMESFKKPDIKNEKKFKLRDIEGFKKEIEVRALLQDKPAPLVIIFLGLATKSKDPLARLWQAQLFEAGNSVMCFDSVFRASFNQRSCHGVAGNLEAESCVAAKVIGAFLEHPEVKDKPTRIGLVGASYGGMLALNFAKLAKEGRIRIAPERVLVFSPPISMKNSAVILDKFYDEDRQKTGIFDLLEMSGHKPVGPGKKIPFTESQMRAGIGYVFHDDLDDAIKCSKDVYKFELPKKDGEKNRRCFTRFIEQVVYPYWKEHGVKSLDELWESGNLAKLLNACGSNVHAIVAVDDPLNDPLLLKYMKRDVPAEKLTVLPRGGHLGFIGCSWARDRVLKLFE
jgi:predicted alpha/beta-fold hydrolase